MVAGRSTVRVAPQDLRPGMVIFREGGDRQVLVRAEQKTTWFHGRGGWELVCENDVTIYIHRDDKVEVQAEDYEF